MVAAPDFDRKMLLLACQLSHEMDLKTLLLTVLRALLDTLNAQTRLESMAEAMTLIRCIIRLVLKLLGEPAANRRVLIPTLLQYFSSARSLVEDASPENRALVIKDLSWLWRTAYNTAIQGCSEWDEGEENLSDMFELSVQLLELYIAHSPVGVDASIHTYLIDASFAAISGRVIVARRQCAEQDSLPVRTGLPFRRSKIRSFSHSRQLVILLPVPRLNASARCPTESMRASVKYPPSSQKAGFPPSRRRSKFMPSFT